jgi:hypothetical protein
VSLGQYRTIRCHYESTEGEQAVDVRLTHDGLGHRDWAWDSSSQDAIDQLPEDQRESVEQQAIDGWMAAEAAEYDEEGRPLVKRGSGAPTNAYYRSRGQYPLAVRVPQHTLGQLAALAAAEGTSQGAVVARLVAEASSEKVVDSSGVIPSSCKQST